jgi:hypothetical protein
MSQRFCQPIPKTAAIVEGFISHAFALPMLLGTSFNPSSKDKAPFATNVRISQRMSRYHFWFKIGTKGLCKITGVQETAGCVTLVSLILRSSFKHYVCDAET